RFAPKNAAINALLTTKPFQNPVNSKYLEKYLKIQCDNQILLGDLNAKSQTWGANTLDAKGEQIENLLLDQNLFIINNGKPTYLSKTHKTLSHLDITAVNHSIVKLCKWDVLENCISDHFPIMIQKSSEAEPLKQVKKSWNFKKANWDKFSIILEDKIQNSTEKSTDKLNEKVTFFTEAIQHAARKSVPRGKRRHNWIPNWKNENIGKLLKERDQLQKTIIENGKTENAEKIGQLSKEIEEKIATSKLEIWKETCQNIGNEQEGKLWKLLKNIEGEQGNTDRTTNIIENNCSQAKNDKEAAEMLAKYYSSKSRLPYNAEDKKEKAKATKCLKLAQNDEQIGFNSNFETYELEHSIKTFAANKAPGEDLIFGHMVKHIGTKAKSMLLDIINMSWKCGKLPTIWKTSAIIPILKPNKAAKDCSSYRPIALTSILCKIMEKMIHRRLYEWLKKYGKLDNFQTAYQSQLGTEDQLFSLTQSIIDGFQERKKTSAVFLDMSAAFDTVWRQKLINISHKLGIQGKMLIWINDFLRN
ncbi:MAG TPA: hypothetical protein DDZ39_07810, partial [Flavobacteriaceae bacterium]|nr:hypothetical protein [Flavobacteriaceae bacterium]